MSEQPNTVTVDADRWRELQEIERRLIRQIGECNRLLADAPEGSARKAFANVVKMLEGIRGPRR